MPKRFICTNCRKVYRSKAKCKKTGCDVITKDYAHAWYGIVAYIWAISGVVTLFVIAPFSEYGELLMLSAFFDLAVAGILSTIDDRRIDKLARFDMELMLCQPEPSQQPQFPPLITYPSKTQPNKLQITHPSQTQPSQPPTPQYRCTDCGNIISWVQQYNRWYCPICRNYK